MTAPLIGLRDKVALITGASSGIGRATAILFHKLGASVVITGRSAERLQTLADELTVDGEPEAFVAVADLAKDEDIKTLVEKTITKFKKLDILVNCAGVLALGTLENTSVEDFDRVLRVNLRSAFFLTSLLVPHLIETKGAIVNVSSVSGMRSFPGVLAYNVSKAGLDQFTRSAALDLASKGVRVNSVNPGATETELHRNGGMDEATYAAFLEHSKKTHAMGRVGTSDEVASTIAFLASGAAAFVTGACVPVDGGRHAMSPRDVQDGEDGAFESIPSGDVQENGLLSANILTELLKLSNRPSSSTGGRRRKPAKTTASRQGGRLQGAANVKLEVVEGDGEGRATPKSTINRKLGRPPGSRKRGTLITAAEPELEKVEPTVYGLRASTLRSLGKFATRGSGKETGEGDAAAASSTPRKKKPALPLGTTPVTLDDLNLEMSDREDESEELGLEGEEINEASLAPGEGDEQAGAGDTGNVDGGGDGEGGVAAAKHEAEMTSNVSLMTSSVVYRNTFAHAWKDAPLDLLTAEEISDESVPVNTTVPQIRLAGLRASMSFIVDTSTIPPGSIVEDGLGSWNVGHARRGTVRKLFFAANREKCTEAGHKFCLIRRGFFHGHCTPRDAIKKVIWQCKGNDEKYFRYALVTYNIQAKATVDAPPVKRPQKRPQPFLVECDEQKEILRDQAIAALTSSPVYRKFYLNTVESIPLALMLEPVISHEPICESTPRLNPEALPEDMSLQLSFLIDSTMAGVSQLGNDGLGSWNSAGGPRMSVRKHFFTWDRQKCLEGEHDFFVVRRTFVHPNCTPEGAVRKNMWLVRVRDGYARYVLITYDILPKASITMVSRGKQTRPRKTERRTPERLPKKRIGELLFSDPTSVAKRRRALGDAANVSGRWDDEESTHEIFSHDALVERMSQHSSRHFTQPYHNDEPFCLMFLSDTAIGQPLCASCGIEFSRHPLAPEDLILEHIERFWNQRTSSYSSQQMQKKYIHARIDCVLTRYEYFTTADFLSISRSVRERLTGVHLDYLYEEFGCSLD